MRAISFVNFKGGVGKTSLCVNLAACLAHDLGQKVLLVDCDSQANSSIWLMGVPRWGVLNAKPELSLSRAFQASGPELSECVVHGPIRDEAGAELCPNLDVLPATYHLSDFEHAPIPGRGPTYYRRFAENLGPVIAGYDYVLFDCPPNVMRLTKSAVFSSADLYVPCNPDLLSFIGLHLLVERLAQFREESDGDRRGGEFAKVRGLILNAYNRAANYGTMVTQMRAKIHALRKRSEVVDGAADVLTNAVGLYIQAGRAAAHYLPVTLLPGSSQLKEDYLNLARFIHQHPSNP